MKLSRTEKFKLKAAMLALLMATAALLPLVESREQKKSHAIPPAWPATFEGVALKRVPLGKRAQAALNRFPGEVALFTDGAHYILLRRVTRATRQLHSSADCLRGMGHRIRSRTVIRRDDGNLWARFTTDQGIEAFEQIRNTQSPQVWTDVSAWFWSATFDRDGGPWLAVTVFDSDFQ